MSLTLANPSLTRLRLIGMSSINKNSLGNTSLNASEISVAKVTLLVKSKDIR